MSNQGCKIHVAIGSHEDGSSDSSGLAEIWLAAVRGLLGLRSCVLTLTSFVPQHLVML